MLDPEYLQEITEGATEIADELHTDIIKRIVGRIMRRLGRGEEYILTQTDRWQIGVLQDAGYLLEDITADIAKYTLLQQAEIKAAMEDAGIKAVSYDDKVYEAAGLSPKPLLQSPHQIRLMQRNYEATMGTWKNFTRSTANETQKLFINECDKAYSMVSSGAASYTQAVMEAIDKAVRDGAVVSYPSGHSDTIETATMRAVRTGISQSTGDIQMQRMMEMDWDIILVSSHLGARTGNGEETAENHSWWQGKFYSRTGRDEKFPPFSVTGYGTATGLCGINCRHSFGPGDGENNPYRQFDSEENKKAYDLSQRQRALERRVRKTKREVAALQEAVEHCEDEKLGFELQQKLDKKSYLLKQQNKGYKEFCEENGLKPYQERLQTAKWDREKAAKATGAARRYENAANQMKSEPIQGNKMEGQKDEQDEKIQWPPKGVKISNEEYKDLMKYSREKGIELSGFKQYDGNTQTIKDMIDDADTIAERYPEIRTGKRRLTIELNETMDSKDFAITRGHIVSVNANAFRDEKMLEDEYAKAVESGWFVNGTNYRSIIKHEIGHVIANKYKLNGLEIARNIIGAKGDSELLLYIKKHVSEYAQVNGDGSEIIAECFSSVLSGQKNNFALKFIDECDKIIKKKQEGAL